jgi:GTPase SAR1 family protein
MGLFSFIGKGWVRVNSFFWGKKILVLGKKAVGKTTFQRFIREGYIPEIYEATDVARLPFGQFKQSNMKFYIKEGYDVGGTEDLREFWRKFFIKADLCFYLFNAHDIYQNKRKTVVPVRHHLNLLNTWREMYGLTLPVIVIGSFADMIPINDSNEASIERNLRLSLQAGLDKGRVQPHHFFIGSLKDERTAWILLNKVIRVLKADGVL